MSLSRSSTSKRRAGSAAVLALVALLASCNSDTTPNTLPTVPTPGASSPGASSPTSTPATTVPSLEVSPIPSTTKPKPSATASGGGATGALDLTCARRGVDTQGITVQTAPGGPAGFNSLYADGSSSVDGKSDYKTGFDARFADGAGVFRSTWVPPPNAPAGPAIVRVITQFGQFDLVYRLAAQDGTCP